MPEVYEFLEAEQIKYAIRLPANQVLQSRIGYLLTRPVGRPPHHVRRFYANFGYQAGTWTKPRRVIAKVEWPPGRARRCFLQQARDVRAINQGGQRRDQVDATVVPNVRRQRGAAPASCTRLQPRQFPAHAGDARADQGLVADESEGQADQDRRECGEPRPLCYLPDGRGRHRTANVPRDFAAHRGATAAATTSASVRRSMSCTQEQPTEGVRPNARENDQIRPSTKRSGYPRCLVALQEDRENANIDAGLGFIWRISVYVDGISSSNPGCHVSVLANLDPHDCCGSSHRRVGRRLDRESYSPKAVSQFHWNG